MSLSLGQTNFHKIVGWHRQRTYKRSKSKTHSQRTSQQWKHEPAFGMTAVKLDQTHMKMKLKGAGIWHDSSQTMSWSVPYHEAEGSRHLTWQLSNNDTIRPISRREAGCKKGGQMQGNSLLTGYSCQLSNTLPRYLRWNKVSLLGSSDRKALPPGGLPTRRSCNSQFFFPMSCLWRTGMQGSMAYQLCGRRSPWWELIIYARWLAMIFMIWERSMMSEPCGVILTRNGDYYRAS